MLSNEIWKPVVGYEELYEVSNKGRVKALKRRKNCNRGYGYSTDKYDLVESCNKGLEKVKEVEILQMIICGDKEVIAEVIFKEDFEKYFERSDT